MGMNLTNPGARCSLAVNKRIAALLDVGCHCGSETATLTRRLVNGSVTIHLQCTTCGRSISGSLPRLAFYFYQDYPEWDAELPRNYAIHSNARVKEYHEAREQAFAERRRDCEVWLAESPEWKSLRSRVLDRANLKCEACLNDRASQVHHLTYSYGQIPPAWELRAVCRNCHLKLHREWREGADRQDLYRRVREILG